MPCLASSRQVLQTARPSLVVDTWPATNWNDRRPWDCRRPADLDRSRRDKQNEQAAPSASRALDTKVTASHSVRLINFTILLYRHFIFWAILLLVLLVVIMLHPPTHLLIQRVLLFRTWRVSTQKDWNAYRFLFTNTGIHMLRECVVVTKSAKTTHRRPHLVWDGAARFYPPFPPLPSFRSLPFHPLSSFPSPPVSFNPLFLPLEVGPLNPAMGLGERCRPKLPQRGLGQSPSRNRIWCILA